MSLKLMGGMLRTVVVTAATSGLLTAVEDALVQFQKRIVERTTYQEAPPAREVQESPISPVTLERLTPSPAKRPLTTLLGLLELWVLAQHWRLPFEAPHEEPPLAVGAATAARAQAEATMRASLENIARVKIE